MKFPSYQNLSRNLGFILKTPIIRSVLYWTYFRSWAPYELGARGYEASGGLGGINMRAPPISHTFPMSKFAFWQTLKNWTDFLLRFYPILVKHD